MSTNSDIFQGILEAKRAELLARAANRDEIRIENAAEDFDRIHQRMDREVAVRNLDRGSRVLKSVAEALDRIGTGEFGVCLRCEEEIPERRLKAVPWASHCLNCQEKLDRRRAKGELDEDSDILKPAA